MDNRRIFEYCLTAAVIALGMPVFALLGAQEGERLASLAYSPEEAAPPAAPAEKDWKTVVTASADAVTKGEALFRANCVACHGEQADGNGAAAAALKPAPRNFLDPKAKWTRSRSALDIYTTLSEGSPGTAMVSFSVSLTPQDRWALVHYIGSLPGVKEGHTALDEATAAAWKP